MIAPFGRPEPGSFTSSQTSSGEPAHSFASLLAHLGTRTRNTVQITAAAEPTTFQQLTEPDTLQAEALRLLTL